MDKPNKKTLNSNDMAVKKAVDDYVAGLSDEHRMLVVLKSQLYGGSWEPMIDDLNNRLEGKPYIFKLVNRIKDDILRINEMKGFEEKNNIDLTDFIELP
ncbi:MAG: hypothetical protein JW787_09940 [Sedimentisphaerales bacterium]|nr:hypothetical protein [Sedimentisphaerales bacterium]